MTTNQIPRIHVLAAPFDYSGNNNDTVLRAWNDRDNIVRTQLQHKCLVVSSPGKHCRHLAKQIARDTSSRFATLLSVLAHPGSSSVTEDPFHRVPKTKDCLDTSQYLGIDALPNKWWPPSFTLLNTLVLEFLAWVHKQPSQNWVVVVTHEYAVELCKQLCATPATPPAAGEWRTYCLPADNPNTFVKSESFVLRFRYNETDLEWKTRVKRCISVHFGLEDTSWNSILKKGITEMKVLKQELCNEVKSQAERVKAYKPSKREQEEIRCPDPNCGADRSTDSIYDPTSGDTCCRQCGYVFSHHSLNDKGSDRRNFEGEPDKSHHSVPNPIDALLSVSSQLETTHSKCFAPPGSHRSMNTSRIVLPSKFKIDAMGRKSVDTRTNLTTQYTKDEHIRQTSALYRRMMLHPDTRISLKVVELAEQMFRNKRNREVSLQPVGTSKTHRPKDQTLAQHQAVTWLAAELYIRARKRRLSTHTYVPLAIADAPTWEKKRSHETMEGRDADTARALIPHQAKRRYNNIRPRTERAQALWAARTQRRESLALARQAAALTAAKMAIQAATHAMAHVAQLQTAP